MSKLIYIASHNSEIYKVDLSRLSKEEFSGAHVICASRAAYEDLTETELPFQAESIDFFGQIGWDLDDDLYRNSQDMCRELINGIDSLDFPDFDLLEYIKESVSLSVGDVYAKPLFQTVTLMERIVDLNCNEIYVTGQNILFLLSLKETIQLNGFECSIIINDSIGNAKFAAALAKLEKENNLKFYSAVSTKKELQIEAEIDSCEKKLKKGDGLILFNPNDKFYRDSIYTLIDEHYDRNVNLIALQFNNISSIEESLYNRISYSVRINKTIYLDAKYVLMVRRAYERAFKNVKMDIFNKYGFLIHENFSRLGIKYLVSGTIGGLFFFRLFSSVLQSTEQKFLLVSPGRTLASRVAVEAANQLGIPTFELQSGTLLRSSRYWRPNAKTVLCADKASLEIYRSFFGIAEENLRLVGSPRMDSYTAPLRVEYEKRTRDGKTVFLALQTLKHDHNIRFISEAIKALEGLPGYRLVVGFHPKDSEINRKPVLRFLGGRPDVKVSDKDSLSQLLESDICVTYYSSLAFEAYSIGLEVIAFRIDNWEWPFRLSELGFASEADDYLELRDRIREIEARPKGEGQLDVYRDGKSAARIWAEIDRQVGNNRVNIFKRLWKRVAS